MAGKIRILADKLDEVVPRFHSNPGPKGQPSKWRGSIWCLCEQCKGFGAKQTKYTPKGRTFRAKIEKSLEGEEWRTYQNEGYQVYEW